MKLPESPKKKFQEASEALKGLVLGEFRSLLRAFQQVLLAFMSLKMTL